MCAVTLFSLTVGIRMCPSDNFKISPPSLPVIENTIPPDSLTNFAALISCTLMFNSVEPPPTEKIKIESFLFTLDAFKYSA